MFPFPFRKQVIRLPQLNLKAHVVNNLIAGGLMLASCSNNLVNINESLTDPRK